MCVPMVGAAISAIGSIASGMGEAAMGKYNARVAEINAAAARQQGNYRGGLERTKGYSEESAAVAAGGASGADISSGSLQSDFATNTFNTEQKSGLAIWQGQTEQTKYLNDAKMYKFQGKQAMIGGIIGGFKSLVGGMSGFGKIGAGGLTPAPAPTAML